MHRALKACSLAPLVGRVSQSSKLPKGTLETVRLVVVIAPVGINEEVQKTMKRRLACTVVALTIAVLLLPLSGVGLAQSTKFEWVIASSATALAVDGSKITLTGTGTFVLGQPEKVSGGGTWQTSDASGTTVTESGHYRVTDLGRFQLAPGAVPDPTIHAGLAQLRIRFSDGSGGILTVSCHLPGSPSSVAEGIEASKDVTDYFNIVDAVAFFRSLN